MLRDDCSRDCCALIRRIIIHQRIELQRLFLQAPLYCAGTQAQCLGDHGKAHLTDVQVIKHHLTNTRAQVDSRQAPAALLLQVRQRDIATQRISWLACSTTSGPKPTSAKKGRNSAAWRCSNVSLNTV